MTVETFTPNRTTTLETPVKILEDTPIKVASGTRIGFVSLGCPKNTPKPFCKSLV
jgi:ribosomal protein S12 methylthiotransferase